MPNLKYKPKGKKIPGYYWLKPQTKNKMQWILSNSDYADYFNSETSLVDQSIAFMYFIMVNKKYDPILKAFLEPPTTSEK